jgi:DNA invertase Pin-like site-specific DNA recombinase
MKRIVIYARYSSDNQREASIEDQFRICEEQADREGWNIAATYNDSAISGSSIILRPGIQALLRDAHSGLFDIVMAEALDRISRDQADVATLYKQLHFLGIKIVTISEGLINELHVGLKGTMNALMLKDLAQKTHRGLRGRVIKQLDARGDPIRGDREINETEANIVRRIFREFAAGIGPRTIARTLNEEGVHGPKGKLWNDTTIRGHVKRGTGIVNNEAYIGRLIWNRSRFITAPATGRRVSRLNPESEWIIKEVPELRIVDDALWQSVRAQQKEIAIKYANVTEAIRNHHNKNRLNGTRRAKSLLSGLVTCGICHGPCSLRGADRFVCSNHISKANCSNSRTIARTELEARALIGLKERLMSPELVNDALDNYNAEISRLHEEHRINANDWQVELKIINAKINQIVEAIADGMYHASMKEKMDQLEMRKVELIALLANIPSDMPVISHNIVDVYSHKIVSVTKALTTPSERQAATQQLHHIIEKIVLKPGANRGQVIATLHGELGTILEWTERQVIGKAAKAKNPATSVTGVSVSVVSWAGFEPFVGQTILNR